MDSSRYILLVDSSKLLVDSSVMLMDSSTFLPEDRFCVVGAKTRSSQHHLLPCFALLSLSPIGLIRSLSFLPLLSIENNNDLPMSIPEGSYYKIVTSYILIVVYTRA